MAALSPRILGPGAGARKYDLLTALALSSLHGERIAPVLCLRLIALITARYDWARDMVAIGHEELARLWGVSRRTVIRDLARLTDIGLIEVAVPGRRGRVASYRLRHAAIDAATAPEWPVAGAAMAARMEAAGQGNDAPLPDASAPRGPDNGALAVLRTRLPAPVLARWIAPLDWIGVEDGVARWRAPSRFHATYVSRTHGDAMLAALRPTQPGLRRIEIVD
jgi:hypothetical protein